MLKSIWHPAGPSGRLFGPRPTLHAPLRTLLQPSGQAGCRSGFDLFYLRSIDTPLFSKFIAKIFIKTTQYEKIINENRSYKNMCGSYLKQPRF